MRIFAMEENTLPPMMGQADQSQYVLRWHNYASNFEHSCQKYYEKSNFTDVTLSCRNGDVLQAHKIVLAASSTYFENILQTPALKSHQYPLIVLKDVSWKQMNQLLLYMYKGEITIEHTDMDSFLEVARHLRIKGLTDQEHRDPKVTQSQNDCLPKVLDSHTSEDPSQSSPTAPSAKRAAANSSCDRVEDSNQVSQTNSLSQQYLNNHQDAHVSQESVPKRFKSMASMNALPFGSLPALHSTSPLEKGICSSPILKNSLTPEAIAAVAASWSKQIPNFLNPCSGLPSNPSFGFPQFDFTNYSPLNYQRPIQTKKEPSEDEEETISPENNRNIDHVEKNSYNFLNVDSPATGRFNGYSSYGQQKPEWKRYKQYTKGDLEKAISAVKEGMPALQASRLHNVPSRTLYDKLKKLGLSSTPRRPVIQKSPPVETSADSQTRPHLIPFDSRSNGSFHTSVEDARENFSFPVKDRSDEPPEPGTTRGSFSVYAPTQTGPLDLTDHDALLSTRPLEERA